MPKVAVVIELGQVWGVEDEDPSREMRTVYAVTNEKGETRVHYFWRDSFMPYSTNINEFRRWVRGDRGVYGAKRLLRTYSHSEMSAEIHRRRTHPTRPLEKQLVELMSGVEKH